MIAAAGGGIDDESGDTPVLNFPFDQHPSRFRLLDPGPDDPGPAPDSHAEPDDCPRAHPTLLDHQFLKRGPGENGRMPGVIVCNDVVYHLGWGGDRGAF